MKASKLGQAQIKWEKNGNIMVAFTPNTCPHENAPAGRWILADKWNVLATAFNESECETLRDNIRRRRG